MNSVKKSESSKQTSPSPPRAVTATTTAAATTKSKPSKSPSPPQKKAYEHFVNSTDLKLLNWVRSHPAYATFRLVNNSSSSNPNPLLAAYEEEEAKTYEFFRCHVADLILNTNVSNNTTTNNNMKIAFSTVSETLFQFLCRTVLTEVDLVAAYATAFAEGHASINSTTALDFTSSSSALYENRLFLAALLRGYVLSHYFESEDTTAATTPSTSSHPLLPVSFVWCTICHELYNQRGLALYAQQQRQEEEKAKLTDTATATAFRLPTCPELCVGRDLTSRGEVLRTHCAKKWKAAPPTATTATTTTHAASAATTQTGKTDAVAPFLDVPLLTFPSSVSPTKSKDGSTTSEVPLYTLDHIRDVEGWCFRLMSGAYFVLCRRCRQLLPLYRVLQPNADTTYGHQCSPHHLSLDYTAPPALPAAAATSPSLMTHLSAIAKWLQTVQQQHQQRVHKKESLLVPFFLSNMSSLSSRPSASASASPPSSATAATATNTKDVNYSFAKSKLLMKPGEEVIRMPVTTDWNDTPATTNNNNNSSTSTNANGAKYTDPKPNPAAASVPLHYKASYYTWSSLDEEQQETARRAIRGAGGGGGSSSVYTTTVAEVTKVFQSETSSSKRLVSPPPPPPSAAAANGKSKDDSGRDVDDDDDDDDDIDDDDDEEGAYNHAGTVIKMDVDILNYYERIFLWDMEFNRAQQYNRYHNITPAAAHPNSKGASRTDAHGIATPKLQLCPLMSGSHESANKAYLSVDPSVYSCHIDINQIQQTGNNNTNTTNNNNSSSAANTVSGGANGVGSPYGSGSKEDGKASMLTGRIGGGATARTARTARTPTAASRAKATAEPSKSATPPTPQTSVSRRRTARAVPPPPITTTTTFSAQTTKGGTSTSGAASTPAPSKRPHTARSGATTTTTTTTTTSTANHKTGTITVTTAAGNKVRYTPLSGSYSALKDPQKSRATAATTTTSATTTDDAGAKKEELSSSVKL